MLVKNGFVASESGMIKADIRLSGEIISEISADGAKLAALEGENIIDAEGMIILPGGVDMHTHMDLDLGHIRATDDFYTGTVAAACGGITTIVDHMAFGPRGNSIRQQVDEYHRLAEGKAVVDYGFHGVVDHVNDAVLAEIKDLAGEGVTSHKFYLTYDRKLSDKEILRLMDFTSDRGILLAVHAENDTLISYLREKFIKEGNTAPVYHARSRPPESETEAVSRMIKFAAVTGDAPLYIVHISCGSSVEIIRAARLGGQKNIFAETCPQYLFLDESLYLAEDGLKYIMSPPLRGEKERKSLWDGLICGDIDTIGTDHCPFFYNREKQLGKDDFTKTPGGAPGVEANLSLMFYQYIIGRLPIGEIVRLCCAEPARLSGIYPKKGLIAVGSDADLTIMHSDKTRVLTHSMFHENTDYTPYEGKLAAECPVMTISRGEIIAQEGSFLGKKGRGRFLKRGFFT